jgi:hypothetical protein
MSDPNAFKEFAKKIEMAIELGKIEVKPDEEVELEEPRQSIAANLFIPPLFEEARVSDFKPTDFAEREFEVHPPRDLLITGTNGAGKSHLACALCFEWDMHRVRAAHICSQVRGTFNTRAESTERQIISLWASYKKLVIDDLTAVSTTPHAIGTLLDLLETRIEDKNITVVTCYQGGKGLKKIDPSIYDRLKGFENVHLTGESRRHGSDMERRG